MIEFRDVTMENFEEVINLKLKDDQVGFLENNLYSLAKAKVNSDLIPKGVYEDYKLVGFILYYFHEGEPDYVYLKRLMIDEKYESLGFKSTGEIRKTIRPGTDYIDKELVRRYFY